MMTIGFDKDRAGVYGSLSVVSLAEKMEGPIWIGSWEHPPGYLTYYLWDEDPGLEEAPLEVRNGIRLLEEDLTSDPLVAGTLKE